MRKSSRKGNQQGKQVQKTITPFARSSAKMADSAEVNTPEETPDTTTETTLSLRMLQEELQTSIETVLAQIKVEIATSFKEIKTDIVFLREETKADIRAIRDELAGELTRLRSAQTEIVNECKEMGIVLCETMDRVTALEKSQQSISKECKKMQDKCQDLENRSRRQNLRLVGITEGAEGGNMIKFLADFFPAVLGADNFSSPVVIDRAHRKTKGRLTYKGDQVHIFPDMSPEVSRQRAAFNPVKRKLREANVTYSLFYPARLAFNVDGIRHSFDSPKAAEDFYDQKIAKVD